MTVYLMAVDLILGFLAHMARETLTGHMKNGWQEISNYTLGVIYVFPLSLIKFCKLKKDVPDDTLRYVVAYSLSFLPFGIGVCIGYWYKPVEDKK
jgi:hypothetical protein